MGTVGTIEVVVVAVVVGEVATAAAATRGAGEVREPLSPERDYFSQFVKGCGKRSGKSDLN